MHRLSPRQQQIVELQGQGLAQKQIADRLHISLGTVKTHLARAQAITGAASGIEMQSGIHRREMSTVEEEIRTIEAVSRRATAFLTKRTAPG